MFRLSSSGVRGEPAENRSEVCRNTHVRAPAPAGAERDGTEVRVPHAVTRGRSVGGDCVGPARSWRARWRSGDASKGRRTVSYHVMRNAAARIWDYSPYRHRGHAFVDHTAQSDSENDLTYTRTAGTKTLRGRGAAA